MSEHNVDLGTESGSHAEETVADSSNEEPQAGSQSVEMQAGSQLESQSGDSQAVEPPLEPQPSTRAEPPSTNRADQPQSSRAGRPRAPASLLSLSNGSPFVNLPDFSVITKEMQKHFKRMKAMAAANPPGADDDEDDDDDSLGSFTDFADVDESTLESFLVDHFARNLWPAGYPTNGTPVVIESASGAHGNVFDVIPISVEEHIRTTGCVSCRVHSNRVLYQNVVIDAVLEDSTPEFNAQEVKVLRVSQLSRNDHPAIGDEPLMELAVIDFLNLNQTQMHSLPNQSYVIERGYSFRVLMADDEMWLARCRTSSVQWPMRRQHYQTVLEDFSSGRSSVFRIFNYMNCENTLSQWLESFKLAKRGIVVLDKLNMDNIDQSCLMPPPELVEKLYDSLVKKGLLPPSVLSAPLPADSDSDSDD